MHFFPSQSEQLFFLLFFGLFCETFTFPFLQEISTESQQQQQPAAAAAAVFVAQNVATPKEKQPPSSQQQKGIPASGIGIEKGEPQSAAQIAERPSEPESAEEVVESELSAVINRINTVESFHEQLELEKETDEGGKDQHGNGKNKPPAVEQMGETAHGHFEPAIEIIAETTTTTQIPELTTAELMPMKEEANGPKEEEKVPTQKEEDHLMEKMGPPTTSAPNEYIAVELMGKENSKKEEEEKEDLDKEKLLPQKFEAMATSLAIENATSSHLTLEYSEAVGGGDSKKIDLAEGEMRGTDGIAENGTAKINDRQIEQPKEVGMPKEEEEENKFFRVAPVPVPDDGTTTIDGPSIQGHPPAPPAAAGQYLVENRVGPTEMAMNGRKGNDEEEEEDPEENEEGLSLWDKIVLGLRCARQDCRDTLIDGDEEEQQRPIKGWKITRRARRSTAPSDNNQINKIECPCTYILHN